MRQVPVNANDSGQRLDKFLSKYMPKLPKSMLYKGLRKNCVKINGKHAKDGSVMLNNGDILTLYFNEEFFSEQTSFKPVEYDIDIVYEDKNIIVLNKKPRISVHAEDKGGTVTLIDMVWSYLYDRGEYNPLAEKSFSPAFVSRLDKNTGGLITCAKNAEALRELNQQIKKRNIGKIYTCIAEGLFSKKHEILSDYLTRQDKTVLVADSGDKEIITEYEVMDECPTHSLLRVTLHTGRTHQIRAHLAYYGHPLAGDRKYGAKIPTIYKYQALWCTELHFNLDDDAKILEYLNNEKIILPLSKTNIELKRIKK